MKYDGNNQLFIARFEDGVWKRMRLIRWNCRWHIQGWGSGRPNWASAPRRLPKTENRFRIRSYPGKEKPGADRREKPAAGRNPGGFGSGFGATSCRRVFVPGYAGTYASARQSPIALGDAADKQRPQACGDSAAFGVGAL